MPHLSFFMLASSVYNRPPQTEESLTKQVSSSAPELLSPSTWNSPLLFVLHRSNQINTTNLCISISFPSIQEATPPLHFISFSLR
jgi:hypothetical protein